MITQEDIEEGLKVLQYEDCNPTHYMQFLYNSESEREFFTTVIISASVGGNTFDLYLPLVVGRRAMDVSWLQSVASACLDVAAFKLPIDVKVMA